MRYILPAIALLSLSLTFSCKSNDEEPAPNNNEISNAFVGTYVTSDTVTIQKVAGPETTVNSRTGTISKLQAKSVKLNSLFQFFCDNQNAAVTEFTMSIDVPGNCGGGTISDFMCTRNGRTLNYSYKVVNDSTYFVKGSAYKQ